MPEQAIQQAGTQQQVTVLADYTADDGSQQVLTQEIISYYFCPDANPADAAMFAAVCQQMHLNPFVGDASLVKYGGKPASVIVSKDALVKRADRMPDFEGMEDGVIYRDAEGNVKKRQGMAVYTSLGEMLLGGWAEIYRTGRKPSYAEVSLEEYDTKKALWVSKPAVMINKVAQATALRKAYPQELARAYDSAEIEDDVPMAQPAVSQNPEPAKTAPAPTPAPSGATPATRPPLTADQASELAEISKAVGDKRAVWDAFQAGGIEAARSMLPSQPAEDTNEVDDIPF